MRKTTWNDKVKSYLLVNPSGLTSFQVYKCRKCEGTTCFSFRICAHCLK